MKKTIPTDRVAQAEAIRELCAYGSHAGFDQALADRITTPFGFTARLVEERVNVHPKGLHIDGMKPGTKVKRIGGWGLAAQIASHVGATYEGSYGRGTEFWRAVQAIQAKLGLKMGENNASASS